MKAMINMHKELQKLIKENPNNVLFLCGAGISLDYPTSLPTVNKFIYDILKECGISDKTINVVFEQFDKTNYRFESLVDEIRKTCDANLVLTKIFDSSTFNKTHHFLSLMLKNGASIITTNFDTCIENACIFENYEINNRFVYNDIDLTNIEKPMTSALIKIHGSQPLKEEGASELVVTIKALAKTEKAFKALPNWRNYLLNLISNKTVVVMGYSCSDDFDIVPLLAESNPQKVIWINFDYNIPIPVFTDNISNIKIHDLANNIPILYFNGRLIPFLHKWSKKISINLCEGTKKYQYTVKEYIDQLYKTQTDKNILCNEIFLSYGLYNEVIFSNKNTKLWVQKIKSEFRLGNYHNVIDLSRKILKSDVSIDILLETLYYLSSALYYECNYEEAIKIAKKCVAVGLEINDMDFYLNSLINLASIQYVYASTLTNEDKREELLNSAQQKYNIVQKRAEGINIEAKANALWGLGDLNRYRGHLQEALNLLQESLIILKKIGNTYAIEQLKKTIEEIEFENEQL